MPSCPSQEERKAMIKALLVTCLLTPSAFAHSAELPGSKEFYGLGNACSQVHTCPSDKPHCCSDGLCWKKCPTYKSFKFKVTEDIILLNSKGDGKFACEPPATMKVLGKNLIECVPSDSKSPDRK